VAFPVKRQFSVPSTFCPSSDGGAFGRPRRSLSSPQPPEAGPERPALRCGVLLASNAVKVNILAHSMGNWVTVEAFQQMKLTGDVKDKSKIGVILLAAPHLDFDVFKSQLRSFGKIEHPCYVILSRDDKALGISSFIAG
jgi:hypothetical protein